MLRMMRSYDVTLTRIIIIDRQQQQLFLLMSGPRQYLILYIGYPSLMKIRLHISG